MKTHIQDKPLVLVGAIAQSSASPITPGGQSSRVRSTAFLLAVMSFSSLSAIVTKELMSDRRGPTATALAALETPENQALSGVETLNADSSEISADLAAAMESIGLMGPSNSDSHLIASDEWGHELELLAQSDEPSSAGGSIQPSAKAGLMSEALGLSPLDGPLPLAQTRTPSDAQWPADTRWFNGRPVRPARTMNMVVTAYSPDWRSCGDSADNITASLHHIETNAGKLVAADPRVLPLGSMITVPGYDKNQIVPVLDKGGAIKGNRLDVLFPTHAQARKWGVRTLKVVIWEYADGAGKADWRKVRDSK